MQNILRYCQKIDNCREYFVWGILKKNDLIHEIKFVGQFVEFLKANERDKGLID